MYNVKIDNLSKDKIIDDYIIDDEDYIVMKYNIYFKNIY